MTFDISEIKNLSTEEKLHIINELWASIDNDKTSSKIEDDEEESPEIVAMLEERMAKYERGEGKFYTGKEARQILKNSLETHRNRKSNG